MERILAQKLRNARQAALFQPREEAELQQFEAKMQKVRGTRHAEQNQKMAADLLSEVRALGRYPIAHHPSEDANKEEERLLAQKLKRTTNGALSAKRRR